MSIQDIGCITAVATVIALALFQWHWARARRDDHDDR